MPQDLPVPSSRRALLAGAAAGVATLAASRLAAPPAVAATDGLALVVGADNTSTNSTTRLTSGQSGGGAQSEAFVVEVQGPAYCAAIHAVANNGSALIAESSSSNTAIDARSGTGTGVYGQSDLGAGVYGATSSADPLIGAVMGVNGTGSAIVGMGNLAGVVGQASDATSGVGVIGVGKSGGQFGSGVGTGLTGYIGALGPSAAPANTALYGEVSNMTHHGLHVRGGVKLQDRSGTKSIPKGAASLAVTVPGITAANFAMATLGANRAGCWVRAVVCSAGKITIYLNVKAPAATPITWLVLG